MAMLIRFIYYKNSQNFSNALHYTFYDNFLFEQIYESVLSNHSEHCFEFKGFEDFLAKRPSKIYILRSAEYASVYQAN